MNSITNTDWRYDRLKDVSEINLCALPANTVDDFTFRYLEISNVNNFGVISEEAMELLQFADAPSRARRLVRKCDVLVSSVRPNLQAIAHAERMCDETLVCSTGFNVVSPRLERVIDRFLYYFLLSEGTRQHFESVAKGVGYPAIDDKDFCSTTVPLPPLPEQKRIASYLDASCAVIDRAVETKQKQLTTLDALRKSIIQKAVTQGLNPNVAMKDHGVAMYGLAPNGWKKGKLRYEIQISNGKFASDKIVDDGEFPIYGGNGVMARSDEWNAAPPFIVIGRVGAYCGNAHYVDEKAWVSDNAMHVTTNHYPQFIAELFTILDFNSQANNTAQPVITGTKIKNTYALLPSRTEQIEIYEFICEQKKKFSMLSENLSSQIATLTAYRKSLIHECVTGKRRISDADVSAVQRGRLDAQAQ